MFGEIRKFLYLWLPPLLYCVAIYWFSSCERPFGIELKVENIDKLIHLAEYSILGFLLIRAIRNSDVNMSGAMAIVITFCLGTFYGLTDELHQSVIPGRSATVSDFIFDSIGTFTGALVFMKLHQRKERAIYGKNITV